MKVTVITPNFNGGDHLEEAIRSVATQRGNGNGLTIQHILIDGGSRDNSLEIARRYRDRLDIIVCGPDTGPASAINKGFRRADGDIIAWLNADDYYYPDTVRRAVATFQRYPSRALGFGRCIIVNANGREIHRGITRFKEAFFPFSCRFLIQSINYVSQPAMFFRRRALESVGPLREDIQAAWDYEFVLRLWRQGGAVRIPGQPLAAFRRHATSISERHFRRQFAEELHAAAIDAGRWAPQTLIHHLVRWGIVAVYSTRAKSS